MPLPLCVGHAKARTAGSASPATTTFQFNVLAIPCPLTNLTTKVRRGTIVRDEGTGKSKVSGHL